MVVNGGWSLMRGFYCSTEIRTGKCMVSLKTSVEPDFTYFYASLITPSRSIGHLCLLRRGLHGFRFEFPHVATLCLQLCHLFLRFSSPCVSRTLPFPFTLMVPCECLSCYLLSILPGRMVYPVPLFLSDMTFNRFFIYYFP